MRFRSLYSWSSIPGKFNADLKSARARKELMKNSFTHLRAERQPEFCPTWVQGATLGWRIQSPIDVTLTPLEQIEIVGGDLAEEAAHAVGKKQIWVRGNAAIALDAPHWLNAFVFETAAGTETMFLPNGLGTIEWRQGWTVEDWGNTGLLVIPSPCSVDLGVEIGLFTPATLKRLASKGMSIAIAPKRRIEILRGDEIARLIPICSECQSL